MDKNFLPYGEITKRTGARPVAIVFGAETVNGLGLIRGLGRAGIPVYALGQEEKALGFYSRYSSGQLVYPDPHHAPEQFITVVRELGGRLKSQGKIGVLIPTSDRVVEIITRHRELLREHFVVHVPDIEVISKTLDKQAQYAMAREVGVPYPTTYTNSEIAQLRQDLETGKQGFPILLKSRETLPAHLRKKFRTAVIENKRDLDDVLSAAARDNVRFIIQDIIPGGDEMLYTFGSCLSSKGGVTAAFTGRKLRQQPPRFGICRVGESKPVAEIARDGAILLHALGFFGISQVEFKFDCRDGKYKLMEVNPRSWSWVGLPIRMGVNLPYAYFCDALGIDIPRLEMAAKRGLYIALFDDLYWSLKARDGKPWSHLFQKYDIVVEPYYAKDDRKPGLVHLWRCGKILSRMAGRKLLKIFGIGAGGQPDRVPNV